MQDTRSADDRFVLLVSAGSTGDALTWSRALIEELRRRGVHAELAIIASAGGPRGADQGIATLPTLEIRVGSPADTAGADAAAGGHVAVDGSGEPASVAPILERLEARGWVPREPAVTRGYSTRERATVEARLRDLGYL